MKVEMNGQQLSRVDQSTFRQICRQHSSAAVARVQRAMQYPSTTVPVNLACLQRQQP